MRRFDYNLGFRHTTTCDLGQLVPIYHEEVLPGDTFRFSAGVLARLAPLQNPVMHEVEMRISSWFVPNRILWTGWEDFITGVDAVTAPPTVAIANTGLDQVPIYMGAARQVQSGLSALPVRAYNMIWNEYFRDIDIQTEVAEDNLAILYVNWEKDYFTRSRPSPQQGTPEQIPAVGYGRIEATTGISTGAITTSFDSSTPKQLEGSDGSITDPLEVSLAAAGITVDALRRSVALQRFAEARSRYGDRYVDYLRWLGIRPSDGRLSRPEFLGGATQRVSVSEVLSTAEGATVGVGDLFGHGIAGLRGRPWRKMFEEAGQIVTVLFIRPRIQYLTQTPKTWFRSDAMDYWQKELELLPWQEIKEREIFGGGSATTTFGYVPRYHEYRSRFSYASGQMGKAGTFTDWHYGRDFSSAPSLNNTFLQCVPATRVYQDTTIPEAQISAVFDVRARRLVGTERTGIEL